MKNIFLLSVLFVFLTSFCMLKIESNFEAKFEIKNNKLQVEALKGFTFSLMTFTKKKDIYFNQSGMINYKVKSEVEHSDFIFKINRQNNKIILEGIKNTNWKTLEFKNTAKVNQNGFLK